MHVCLSHVYLVPEQERRGHLKLMSQMAVVMGAGNRAWVTSASNY